jgi:putative salt-induced outer membrane protein
MQVKVNPFGNKKSLWLVFLCAATLFAAETTAEENLKDLAELEAATEAEQRAEAEVDAAKQRLKEAHARIEKVQELSEEARYKTKTELSYSDTKGNTKTSQFGLALHAERKRKKNTITLDLTALQSSSNGIENNNKWLALLQYDRALSDVLYFNYLVSYGEDKFSGFDYQFNTGPGLGYKLLQSDTQKLDLRGNVLYSKDKIAGGGTNEYVSGLAGLEYAWQILDNLSFHEDATYKLQFDDADNYFVYSKTAINSKINGNFSLGLSYQIDYKNIPAATKERTDRVFLASLIIDY